jgi:triacylglycerol lipase
MAETSQDQRLTNADKFEPLTTLYRPENAYWMGQLSKFAYLRKGDSLDEHGSIVKPENTDDGQAKDPEPDEDKILEELLNLDAGFKNVRGFDSRSSQGIVVRHEEYIVAAFRGTDEIADWLDNINAVSQEGPLGRVHTGFYRALMDIWPQMKAAIRALRAEAKDEEADSQIDKAGKTKEEIKALKKPIIDKIPDLPLWLTGHSLGGALATLATATLIEADETFYGCYTYGSPRAGDREFENRFNTIAKDRVFRFQNNTDIVTRVPARLMGYSHVGSFIYISEDGELSRDVGKWFRFMDTIKGVLSDIGEKGLDSIKDHNIDEYVNAIAEFGRRDLPKP